MVDFSWKITRCVSIQLGTPCAVISVWVSRRISKLGLCYFVVCSSALFVCHSSRGAALALTNFSWSYISGAVRWSAVTNPRLSTFVVTSANLSSGTVRAVLNNERLEAHRERSVLAYMAKKAGFWWLDQLGDDVFDILLIRSTTFWLQKASRLEAQYQTAFCVKFRLVSKIQVQAWWDASGPLTEAIPLGHLFN